MLKVNNLCGFGVRRGVAGPAAWEPDDASNLTLWYDAGSGITHGTAPAVASWADRSGNGHTASQGTVGSRPATSTLAFGGLTSVLFDGSGDNLDNSGGLYSETLAIVFAPTAAVNSSSTAMALVSTALNEGVVALGSATSSLTNEVISAWGQAASSRDGISSTNLASISAGSGHIILIRKNSGDSRHEMHYDGNGDQSDLTNGTTGAWTSHAGRIGQNGSGQPYGGYIAEIVSYSTALSDSDREKLEGYLAHKWGLAGNLPGGHPYKASPP